MRDDFPELNDFLGDPRDAARRRLERRRAAREGSGAPESGQGGLRPKSSRSQSFRSASSRLDTSRSAGSGRSSRTPRSDKADSDDLPAAVEHADLLGASSSLSAHPSCSHGRSHFYFYASGIHVPRPIIIAAGVLVLAALFAGVGVLERSCAGAGPETAVPVQVEGEQGNAEEQAAPETPQAEQADAANLPEGLDAGLSDTLMSLAETDGRMAHIVNNSAALAADGAAEQLKLLELAADEPEAVGFVAAMPERYPSDAGEPYDGQVERGTIPLLMQWDERWGYTRYCGLSFASAGCCPTSLSMVYMGLTGKTDRTPYDMGQLAVQDGYAVDYQGTIGNFLVDAAPDLGLQCEPFASSTSSLLTYLESGYVVICNVGPGDFTSSGHFFVITGIAENGELEINDPYSAVRSAQTWGADTVVGQSIAMYAFRA